MAASEPWMTLRRDRGDCLAALTRPGSELFVAINRDDERVGFILVAPYGLAGSPYIAAIAVAETARDRGIGSQLLRFAETRFVARKHLFLLVSSFNSRAQQLYIRHGFRPVGELPGYVSPAYSELIFYKELV
jgi:ribosomal protein S18 acetylase RimI-like enzyme